MGRRWGSLTTRLELRLEEQLREQIRQAAALEGRSESDWIRDVLAKAARRVARKHAD